MVAYAVLPSVHTIFALFAFWSYFPIPMFALGMCCPSEAPPPPKKKKMRILRAINELC